MVFSLRKNMKTSLVFSILLFNIEFKLYNMIKFDEMMNKTIFIQNKNKKK